MIAQAADVVFAMLILGLAAVAMVYISMALFRRALRNVVRLFRRLKATAPENAKTLQQLGLAPRRLTERMFTLRDYRPYALQLLIQADIVKSTEDGSLYLSEAALERSNMKESAGID